MREIMLSRALSILAALWIGVAKAAPPVAPSAPVSANSPIQPPGAPSANAAGALFNLANTGGRQLVCTRNAPGGQYFNTQFTTSQAMEHFACYTPTGTQDVSLCFGGWQMNPSETDTPASVFSAAGATIASSGSGYGAGDLLTFPISTSSGDFAALTIRVDSVNAAGAITNFHIENPGVYRSLLTSSSTPTLTSGFTVYNNIAEPIGTAFQTAPQQVIVAGWAVSGTGVQAGTTVSSWNSSTGVGAFSQTTTSALTATTPLKFTSTGTGATFNFQWNPYAYHVRAALETSYNSAGVAITAPAANALRQLTVGTYKTWSAAPTPHADFDWQYVTPSADILVPIGGTVCTDPVPLVTTPGSTIGFRIWMNGLNYGLGAFVAPDEYYARASSLPLSDRTLAATIPANGGTAVSMLRPLAVMGTPYTAKRSIAFIGDSIGFGYAGGVYDNPDGLRDYGLLERAVAQTLPWIDLAANSKTFGAMFSTGWGYQKTLDTIRNFGITDVFSEMGTNDFNNSVSPATVLAQEAQVARDYRARGVRTVGSMTLFPRTNTSNVSGTACTGITQRNAMIRDGLKTDGTGNYATPPSWTSASGNVSAGSGTVTMSSLTQSGSGGSTFSIIQYAVVNITDSAPETVTVSSVSGNTWTATFANSHTSPFTFTVQSPYVGIYDYVADISPTFESSIGACTWASFSTMTTDGVHPIPGNNGSPGGNGHGLAASILAPIIAANVH